MYYDFMKGLDVNYVLKGTHVGSRAYGWIFKLIKDDIMKVKRVIQEPVVYRKPLSENPNVSYADFELEVVVDYANNYLVHRINKNPNINVFKPIEK